MKHRTFDKLIKAFPDEPSTIEQMKSLEKRLNIRLSSEQTDFLLSYQDSHFQACEYVKNEGYFHSFLYLDQIEDRYDFLKNDVEVEMGIYCYNGHLLPIAETSYYSEYICIPISPLFKEGVWCMDYEIDESSLPKSEWKARTHYIANSIDEFLTICANNVLES